MKFSTQIARLTMMPRGPAQFGLVFLAALALANPPVLAAQNSAPQPSAAERMSQPGPQAQDLARRTGTWSVTSTLRLTPDATPIVATDIVAERKLIGPYLEEVMKPALGSKTPDFRRISYLTYFAVEGRWQYVSLDTRFPVGIMPAWSFEKEKDGKLTLEFAPLAFVGLGQQVEGRLIRSNFVITRDSEDHEITQQYWTQADGTGRDWLAVQYECVRKH